MSWGCQGSWDGVRVSAWFCFPGAPGPAPCSPGSRQHPHTLGQCPSVHRSYVNGGNRVSLGPDQSSEGTAGAHVTSQAWLPPVLHTASRAGVAQSCQLLTEASCPCPQLHPSPFEASCCPATPGYFGNLGSKLAWAVLFL